MEIGVIDIAPAFEELCSSASVEKLQEILDDIGDEQDLVMQKIRNVVGRHLQEKKKTIIA
ncbi:MAG: hypothetical protein JWM44_1301 [Bacilli bacterium]|nr:hypothetical protein [Bacilli bacterium]